jgi:hypothetical protein
LVPKPQIHISPSCRETTNEEYHPHPRFVASGEKFGSNSSGLQEQIGTNKWKKVEKHLGNAFK